MSRPTVPAAPDRIRELRKVLRLTQEELADRAGLDRTVIVRIESGANKASSFDVRAGLARGFGLSLEDVADLIVGRINVSTALRRARAAAALETRTGTEG